MALFDWLFGAPEATPAVQTQQLPAWYESALQRLVSGTEAAARTHPYQYYDPTQRVEPLTATERTAIGMAPDVAGAYMPGLTSAYEQAEAGTRTLPEIDISKYMSPYQQAVTDVEKREAIRDYEKMMPQLGFQATQRGAFGGARQGVQEAEAQRNLMQRLGDIQARGSQGAFQAGTQFLTGELGRQLQGAGTFSDLGARAQGLGLTGLQAILNTQAPVRNIQQQIRDRAFEEYGRGQGYDLSQLAQVGNILRGTNAPTTTTTTPSAQGTNPLAGLAGLAGTAVGLYNLFPRT